MDRLGVALRGHELRPVGAEAQKEGAVLVGVFQPGVFPAGVRIDQTHRSVSRVRRQQLAIGREGKSRPDPDLGPFPPRTDRPQAQPAPVGRQPFAVGAEADSRAAIDEKLLLELAGPGFPDFDRRSVVAAGDHPSAVGAHGDVPRIVMRANRHRLVRTIGVQHPAALELRDRDHPAIPAAGDVTDRARHGQLVRRADPQQPRRRLIGLDRPAHETGGPVGQQRARRPQTRQNLCLVTRGTRVPCHSAGPTSRRRHAFPRPARVRPNG